MYIYIYHIYTSTVKLGLIMDRVLVKYTLSNKNTNINTLNIKLHFDYTLYTVALQIVHPIIYFNSV